MRAKFLSVGLLAFSVTALAEADDGDLSLQDLLALAKYTGACGILNAQSHFQATTRLDGGDEFIARFWLTEATRLGMTADEYIARCARSIEAYDRVFATVPQN